MVSYGVYINKDYKTIVHQDKPSRSGAGYARLFVLSLVLMGISASVAMKYLPENDAVIPDIDKSTVRTISQDDQPITDPGSAPDAVQFTSDNESSLITEDRTSHETTIPGEGEEEAVRIEDNPWHIVTVKKGDSLAKIFDRMDISPRALHEIISIDDTTKQLKRITPGDEILFKFDGGDFTELKYDLSLTETLAITKIEDTYQADIIHTELISEVREVHGVIDSSLFIAAQSAGLSDNLTMQLIELYGWDIDFALDIRKGDEFYVIYEERFKNGEKVKDGPILAAHFVNQGNHINAVRYVHADGHSDYYSETGHNMRKAFLRTPVNFTRISSRFNLRRKHPVLNKIRAHRGVDYAAPPGTVVKATGDGIVTLAGNKGGYGRTVVLKHGEKYSTLYAHLSKYARGIKHGVRVKQGQTVGYVGMTGLATGPHLHYEFRINNVHRNPLTVKLPKALKIPDAIMNDFREQTRPLFAQLDNLTGKDIQVAKVQKPDRAVVALIDESEEKSVTTQ